MGGERDRDREGERSSKRVAIILCNHLG
uniref:EHS-2 protein n=1 Tax=Homo sapiens TaxID=9606 RepID=V9GZM5_HUMAN|nr:endogenous HIV-1 related sequence - human [Homo sapiens]AAA58452.1 endogenous HIV-1 related sequence [Homo sapiens]